MALVQYKQNESFETIRVLHLVWIFAAFSCVCFGTETTKQELIATIERAEQSVKSLEFEMLYVHTVHSPGADARETMHVEAEGTVTTDPEPKYNLNVKATIPFRDSFSAGGISDPRSLPPWFGSFDGKISRMYEIRGGPSNSTNEGWVTRGTNIERSFLLNGLRLYLPFLRTWNEPDKRIRGLSQFLKFYDDWEVLPCTNPSRVRIELPVHDKQNLTNIIELDLSRGTNIVQYEFRKKHDRTDRGKLVWIDEITLEEIDGCWVPTAYKIQQGSGTGENGEPEQFSVFAVSLHYKALNRPLTDADFTLEFPLGTRVQDKRTGQTTGESIASSLYKNGNRYARYIKEGFRFAPGGTPTYVWMLILFSLLVILFAALLRFRNRQAMRQSSTRLPRKL